MTTRKMLLAAVAALALGFAAPAMAGSPNGSDWTSTATNAGRVTNDGRITNPVFTASINGGAANAATGAAGSASFTTLAGRVPDMGRTTINMSADNSGRVANTGVITGPSASLTYGTSFVNSATGAATSFSQTSVGIGALR